MGLFDAFKKNKKEEPKEENLDIYDIDGISSLSNSRKQERLLEKEKKALEDRKKQYSEETEKNTKEFFEFANKEKEQMQKETEKIIDSNMKIIADVEGRLKQIDNLPGAQRADEVARNQAIKLRNVADQAKKDKELEKYKEIESAFIMYNGLGLIPTKFDKEQKTRFFELTKDQKDDMFLPYLIEKIYSGIDDDKTKKYLKERIRDKGEKIQEQYTSGVELLQAFGLIDIKDKEIFSFSFDKYSLKTRDEIKRQSELSGMIDDKKDDSFEKGGSNTK